VSEEDPWLSSLPANVAAADDATATTEDVDQRLPTQAAEPQVPPGERSHLSTPQYYVVGFVLLIAVLVLGFLGVPSPTSDRMGPYLATRLAVGVLFTGVFVFLLFQESWRSARHRVRTGVLSLTVVLLATLLTGMASILFALFSASDQDMFGGPQPTQPGLAALFAALAVLEIFGPLVGGLVVLVGRSRTTFVTGSAMAVIALLGRVAGDAVYLAMSL